MGIAPDSHRAGITGWSPGARAVTLAELAHPSSAGRERAPEPTGRGRGAADRLFL